MNRETGISDAVVDALLEKLLLEAEASGYHLNPDREFTRELVRSLLVNQERYGYWACPCRLAAGDKAVDLDIICPCDYRDADLNEFGACFCALYVGQEILAGKKQAAAIPERRPPASERRAAMSATSGTAPLGKLSLPVWRCKVCGYLCARADPPEVCPICKAKRDRFERFI
ncbi:MAG: ferredoxin:glutaredoxin reductase [Chrysiogenales bacterium]|nr:MAG: ferredoxin:glutaredoxin reductase [Chrysiogenales bacterium]